MQNYSSYFSEIQNIGNSIDVNSGGLAELWIMVYAYNGKLHSYKKEWECSLCMDKEKFLK